MQVQNKYRNIFVTNTGIALKNFRLILSSVYTNYSNKHFYQYAIFKYFTSKRERLKKAENYLLIHNHWSRGYHHWVVESLVRLLSIPKKELKNLVLLLPEHYPSFVFQSIESFPFKAIYKIPHKKCLSVPQIIIPQVPQYKKFSQSDITSLRNYFYDIYNIESNSIEPSKRIYVSRKNAKMRLVENEAEVENLLKKYGFDIVLAEELSFQEQVLLFSQCEVFISIHGAALTNLIFMTEGTQVLEFFRLLKNDLPPKTLCFDQLAIAANIKFSTLYFPTGNNFAQHPDRANLVIGINELDRWLLNHL